MRFFLALCLHLVAVCALVAQTDSTRILVSSRADGLYTSSRAAVQHLLRMQEPALRFRPDLSADDFPVWQGQVRAAMVQLMRHPACEAMPPRRVCSAQRDGYRIERWESFPLPQSVVAYYLLVPDGVTAESPATAAVLCLPGFGQTKELLAGERAGDYLLAHGGDPDAGRAAQARMYAKMGLVAVAVDSPSCGELADLGQFDYLNTSRVLLEMGWSYLGMASWQDLVVLRWLQRQDFVPRERIILSGFSLGTEPMMVLGLLDRSVWAFVYNDFLCNTRERILTMTRPDASGRRPFPNSIEHLIPSFLTQFDFPDICAALAPRPLLFTEGGLDRDFRLVRQAYALAGAPDAVEVHHYAAYEADSLRMQCDTLPEGLDRQAFFRLVNCDSPRHSFKTEHVVPWLHRLLGQ